MTVAEKLQNNPTVSVESIVGLKFFKWYMDLCKDMDIKLNNAKKFDLVKFHIKALGKQKYTWIGSFKYWIWELQFDKNMLRLFINNEKGMCLEVPPNTSSSKAMKMANMYKYIIMSNL